MWMRKWVKCTGDMTLFIKIADWGYVRINGHMVLGRYVSGYNHNLFGLPYIRIPDEWLDPSGDQLITIHAMASPKRKASGHLASLYADVEVRGTYDPGETF